MATRPRRTARPGEGHRLRFELFRDGVRDGWISSARVRECAEANDMDPAEELLLRQSLRLCGVALDE